MAVPIQFPDSHCESSYPIPDEEFLDSGAISLIPVRRSNMYREAEHIVATLRRDWAASVGGYNNHEHDTGDNTISGYVHCLILPEAKLDRFEHTVWFTEFFILVDDKAEDLTREMAHTKLKPNIARILVDKGQRNPESAVERILVPAIGKLLKKDYIRGCRVLDALHYWLLNVDSKSLEDFDTLEDHKEFKIINCGLMPYTYMMEYDMELTLRDSERQDAKKLERLAFKCIGVSNNLWSWSKEAQAYRKGKRVMNAILVMKTKSLTAHQAIILIKN
ncbi:hypothetical protein SI65_03882 [Aspergillus cristatus]|uniref:Uncharacterized protein n=1 Tax=Aspergillus cristatus TaxID=573508 RepID=A0A1E3BIQ7_ASPCR|nr:hypothetical protein SI65_03882 [Aspergillus cristatus]